MAFGDVGGHRLHLAGVAAAVAAEHAGDPAAVAARQLGGRADQQRLERLLERALDDVGHDAGDVVAAAGLEAGADHLDHGVVGAAAAEDVGHPGVVEHAAGAVTAEEQPVAGRQVDVEQVGLGLVDAVDGLEDEVAVRVDPRLLLGDPALVDERLDERVVLGELGEGAAALEVGAAVADVADRDPGAVEQRDGQRGAGAVDGRVVLDQLADPVVGAVDGAGDQGQQVVAGRVVELAQLLHRGGGGDVTTGGAADAVADGEHPGAGVPGVLVVLANAADVREPREPEAQRGVVGGCGHGATSSARGSSCRCGPGCPGTAWWAG